jgi:hypothetical protein
MGIKWLVNLFGSWGSTGMWFSEDQGENTIKTHMFKRDWTTFININKYFTLNSEHNWGNTYYT